MSGANVWPGLVSRATMPKSSAEAACCRRFTTKSSSTRSEMTSLSRRHVPSVKTLLLGTGRGAHRSSTVATQQEQTQALCAKTAPWCWAAQAQIQSCKATSCVSITPRPAPDLSVSLNLLMETCSPGKKKLQLQGFECHQVVFHLHLQSSTGVCRNTSSM